MSGDRRYLAVGLVAVILTAGVAIGVVIDRKWLSHQVSAERPRPRMSRLPEQQLELFSEQLQLTPEQESKLQEIFDATQEEAAGVFERLEPEMVAIRERSRAQVREVLSPEQAEKYDQMTREFELRREQRMERMRSGRGSGRGGGHHGKGRGHHGRGLERGAVFHELDGDGDGKISRPELEKGNHPVVRGLLESFTLLDTDRDDHLSLEELEQSRGNRLGPSRPGPP